MTSFSTYNYSIATMIKQIFIVFALGLGLYVALEPSPEGVEMPWKLKLFTLFGKMIARLSNMVCSSSLVPEGVTDWLEMTAREAMRNSGGPNVSYTDTVFDGVPVRVFADELQGGETAAARPAIVYYHGGGWSGGNIDMYHSLTALIARNSKSIVVSVEYRLVPEHVFPAAIDDCTAATVSFLRHLTDYNVDPGRVAVMGDSAGGNLAAAVAQRLTFDPKYQDLPTLKLQVLIYPALQAFDIQTPSYQQNGDYYTIVLDRIMMTNFWTGYMNGDTSLKIPMSKNQHTSVAAKASSLVKKCLPYHFIPSDFKKGYEAPSTDFGDEGIYDEIKEVLLNPDFAPLMREDLRGLPEAYILTAEYDVLRDDGIMYAKRLEKAGVRVVLKHYKKAFHGIINFIVGFLSTSTSNLISADFFEFIANNL